jgi:aspartate racemase
MRPAPRTVALLATAATLVGRIYHDRLERRGFACTEPAAAVMDDAVLPGIVLVKKGDLDAAAKLFRRAIEEQLEGGADAVLLACSEIPPALGPDDPLGARCVDATEALAQAAVDWFLARKSA